MIYILCVKEFFKTNNITFVYLDLKNREEVCIPFSRELEDDYKNRLIEVSRKIDNYESAPKKPECNKKDNETSTFPCEYSIICY